MSDRPQISLPKDEDEIFGPPIDEDIYSDISSSWEPITWQPRRLVDDEDSDNDTLSSVLAGYQAEDDDVSLSSRVRIRDSWGRGITLDDKPVDYNLPTRNKGPREYHWKQPTFNGILCGGGNGGTPGADNRCGLLGDDCAKDVFGEDMDAVGLDPCIHGDDGKEAHIKVQGVLPGGVPQSAEEPHSEPRGLVEYDFSFIEMLLSSQRVQRRSPDGDPKLPLPITNRRR